MDLKTELLIPPDPLINFEIQKNYQNEPRFNGLYSRDNLREKKDAIYVINLVEYSDIGNHWIALQALNDNVTYFDSFEAEHIPKEIKKFIRSKNIKTNIFRIQAYTLMVLIFPVFSFWKKIAFRGYLFSRCAHSRIFSRVLIFADC